MTAPTLSVALVTRNRPDSLRRTLASLRAQSARPDEVVISDDSDDAQSPATAGLAAEFGCRYVRGPRRGLYANRNRAASACLGTHVRTMDDDHEFPPGHLARCREAVAADPGAVWVIGEFYPADRQTGPPPCPGQLTPRGYSATPPDPDRCWAISCGASIYPRTVFERAGGNAEFFKFGPMYLELGSRLHWLGHRIRFLPTTHVVHHYDPRGRSFMELETDLAAQFFAMHCHTRLYQPTARNRAWAAVETVKLLALHRGAAWRAWRAAGRAFAAHRPAVLAARAAENPA
ncbi:MAG: glycosyltransferase [Gemmataceae bacterium]|nr:glycosyltransferase [Gemmataceae bacterium]